MGFSFFPKEFSFFKLFNEQVGYAVEAAGYFKELTKTGAFDEAALDKIHHLEQLSDNAAHEIIDQLNKSFITPFDREDIHALAIETDDIIDILNAIVNRLNVYKITKVDKGLIRFAEVIEESVKAVATAVKCLDHKKNSKLVNAACVEINRLENIGDDLRDKLIGELFENEKDPIEVIKWKDIYQDAETVLDICEDVSHIVDSILVKHS